MKRKTANIDIRVEPQLIEKIDAWRARQRVSPSRAAAIVYMLEHSSSMLFGYHPAAIRRSLDAGVSVQKTAALHHVGTSTVQRIKTQVSG